MNNLNVFKLYINITIKSLSYKQIIILINSNNLKKFLFLLSKHVINFNYVLKDIKSKIFVNFIRFNYKRLIIVFYKVISLFNISIINNYIKNTNNLNVNDV